jgi:hypothetical protein
VHCGVSLKCHRQYEPQLNVLREYMNGRNVSFRLELILMVTVSFVTFHDVRFELSNPKSNVLNRRDYVSE